jgi:hypothetical protein
VLDLDALCVEGQRGGTVARHEPGYHGPAEVLAPSRRRSRPAKYFFRTVMRFETGAPGLDWLNKTIALATAERKARQVLLNANRVL